MTKQKQNTTEHNQTSKIVNIKAQIEKKGTYAALLEYGLNNGYLNETNSTSIQKKLDITHEELEHLEKQLSGEIEDPCYHINNH